MSRWVVLLAGLAGARALAFWLGFHADLDPDTGLYAQGGLGLFPSPLGRLIGLGGVWSLALVNVAANVALVLVIARVAVMLGGRGWVAAAVFVVTPLSWWTIFAGVDTAAAACLVGSFAFGPRGRFLALVAVGLHLAALLVVAAYVAVAYPVRALWLVAGGIALALATPYRGVVLELDPRTATSAALLTALLAGITCPFVFGRAAILVLPALAGGALAAGLVASASWETNARYMLPAVALGSAVLGGPYAIRVRAEA